MSDKRIAHPVRWRHDLLMFEDSVGNCYECREIADAINAALERLLNAEGVDEEVEAYLAKLTGDSQGVEK